MECKWHSHPPHPPHPHSSHTLLPRCFCSPAYSSKKDNDEQRHPITLEMETNPGMNPIDNMRQATIDGKDLDEQREEKMVDLYRWKRTSGGGKEFVKVSVPTKMLEEPV